MTDTFNEAKAALNQANRAVSDVGQILNKATNLAQQVNNLSFRVGLQTTRLVDASTMRLRGAGLGEREIREGTNKSAWRDSPNDTKNENSLPTDNQTDWRVSIRCPAFDNQAIIFPIIPQIQLTDTANYSPGKLTHSNYSMQFYEGSEVSQIQVQAEFPVQSEEEGQKLLDAVRFARTATKMFWGSGLYAGTPPPLVFLNGYGDNYLDDVPCVIISTTHTMPEDKDFIVVGKTRVPTQSTLAIVLQPVYSRNQLRNDYASKGALPNILYGKGPFI